MPFDVSVAGWRVRRAGDAADLAAVRRLRHAAFRAGTGAAAGGAARPDAGAEGGPVSGPVPDAVRGPVPGAGPGSRAGAGGGAGAGPNEPGRPGPGPGRGQELDACPHDPDFEHLMVEAAEDGRCVATFRHRLLGPGDMAGSYCGAAYDLSPLAARGLTALELGRFCVAPGLDDPAPMRLAWGAVAALVTARRPDLLIGCASLPGADPARYGPALSVLAGHVGPEGMRPGRRAAETCDLPPPGAGSPATLPPLLRFYLTLGGWVSDHAVIDRDLGTLHLFCAIEIARIPPARARALAGLAAAAGLGPETGPETGDGSATVDCAPLAAGAGRV
ncbi:GNAT family N-acetyltransferase [Wenxinia saemankumensis]|uniref:L-ornithine N(alpha)-acyltransferase n=1 Tax=Wenxinia saemankumensis TaxID=1447782 RepID=A0A1M6A468_9RHOB|nr:GNAT family N-acyltransferase [Wenxinia saemankumensis]SHI31246.1 Acetyltransferase (GNAT) domain-containing protein [Wenxinia saemankumensis]